MPVVKRPYTQRLRAESAAENRRRILEALYERLREAPSEPISMDEIAARARVSRSTIYLDFGSRSGLFDALTEHLLTGAGYDLIVAAVRDPDPKASLRGGLEGGIRMYAQHHDVLRILNSMAKLDPAGVGQALARSEQERTRGIARVARRLHRAGLLRPGVGVDHAADVIWVLASFEAYDQLASGRGMSPTRIAETLVRTAEAALLA